VADEIVVVDQIDLATISQNLNENGVIRPNEHIAESPSTDFKPSVIDTFGAIGESTTTPLLERIQKRGNHHKKHTSLKFALDKTSKVDINDFKEARIHVSVDRDEKPAKDIQDESISKSIQVDHLLKCITETYG
jgi:hypothetical protein